MDELWSIRQDMLKELSESMVTLNLAWNRTCKIVAQIQLVQIEDADVLYRLIETLKRVDEEQGGMRNDESIVGALQELEDRLSDIDQAR